MTEAFDYTATAPARITPPGAAAVAALLAQGGDARIALDPATGRNPYGCATAPESLAADFGSSTASTVSARGHAAAQALHARIAGQPPAAAYAREMARVRRELVSLCGLEDIPGLEVIFAASGTDLHLLAAALVGGTPDRPLIAIDVEASETGSGVPAALAGRHFSTRAALGASVAQGAPAGPHGEFVAVAARDAAGRLRAAADIEADLDSVSLAAQRAGRSALLCVADVSKTGLISPSPAAALALARRFPQTLTVLVDACQFRLSPASLRAWLAQGFMVAVTGSKFLTGPTFSGALFVPAPLAARFASRILPPGLAAYSARADWPAGWLAAAQLPNAANLGLLLRWEAALAELRAFRALPQAELEGFMRTFARVVRQRLADDPAFEPVATRRLDRGAIGAFTGWDRTQTIFPFRVMRPGGGGLTADQTAALYRSLLDAGVRLGQPVHCGEGVSALRLCNSARLAIEALGGGDAGAVIARALGALDRVATAARAAS